MALRLDEMQNYIRLASNSDLKAPAEVNEIIVEAKQPHTDQHSKMLVEDIKEAVFKMQSYREMSNDQSYALGVEEGLVLAADMITKVIERYNSSLEDN